LLIFGTGAMAEQVHYYFTQHAGRRVEAFTVDAGYVGDGRFGGLPVLAFSEAQLRFPPATHDLFVAIGYTQRNQARRRMFLAARALGYTLPSFVHESAVLARNVSVGANCLVRELSTVQPFAVLGDNLNVAVRVIVSHHVRIGDHCFLAPGAVVCGGSTIGEACFIGAGATIRDGVTVGAGCVIGAGALILSDCEPDGVYAAPGTPRQALGR